MEERGCNSTRSGRSDDYPAVLGDICASHCVCSGDFLHLCEAESGPLAALVEQRLFLAGL